MAERRLDPKRALQALRDLRAQIKRLEDAPHEPVAVVGAGCRLPGGVRDLAGYWQLISEGRDGISEVPPDRWDADALWSADPEAAGRTTTRWGGFVDDLGEFDAPFFGVSAYEAQDMDPQHRQLLETSWEALENAGIPPVTLKGERVGIFFGMFNSDYGRRVLGDLEHMGTHALGGAHFSMAAGRVAYTLDVHGPALVVDTACSSSLVAVHLAVRSLRSGDCSMALAGGASAIIDPAQAIGSAKMGILSRTGTTRVFDAAADGFMLGEGCGVVVLKTLSRARADGDAILAVIRGTAVNQDGRSVGITAPNGRAQQEVVRAALEDARVDAADISYVEAHGTGTAVGDPIELDALAGALGPPASGARPVVVGAVKANVGHLEAAAGIAGLLKALLVVKHGHTGPQINFEVLNPKIALDGTRLRIAPAGADLLGQPRRAGVSSFGVSGTNAHLVLEQAPGDGAALGAPAAAAGEGRSASREVSLVLSGETEVALRRNAERLAAWLEARPELGLADVGYSLVTTRSLRRRRAVVTCALGRRDEAMGRLRTLGRGEPDDGVEHGPVSGRGGRLVAIFAGQDSEQAGTGRDLYAHDARFRQAMDEVASAVSRELGQPVLELILAEEADGRRAPLHRAELAQPALFTLEVALWRRMLASGIEPDLLLGQGVGEIAALYAAGRLGLDDAAALAVARGRAAQALELHGQGAATAEFARRAAQLPLGDAAVEVHGLLLGRPLQLDDLRREAYWEQQLREPGALGDGVKQLATEGAGTWLACGPAGDPCELVGQGAESNVRVSTLSTEAGGLSRALAMLHAAGHRVDWRQEYAGSGAKRVELPTYAFDHARYWLSEARRRQTMGGADDGLASWLYEEQWRERPLGGEQAGAPGRWLLLDDVDHAAAEGEQAYAALTGAGAEVSRLGGDVGEGVLARHLEQTGELAGVLVPVYAGGMPRALAVAQALSGSTSSVPIWLVTRGAVAVDGAEPVDPDQTAVWGLGRAVSLERPERLWGLVDLGHSADQGAWAAVARAILQLGDDGEDQLAVRGGRLWVRRVVRATPGERREPFETSGAALVTGGTGALGARVARWLVQRGATQVVLVSRRGADAARTPLLQQVQQDVEARGATLRIEACDVTDAAAVERLVQELVCGEVPLRSVVHTAGVGTRCRLSEVTPEHVGEVLGAKVLGAKHLDAALGATELDAFVLYGSVSALWGAGEQSVYGAANAYLVGLAQRRRSLGLRGAVVQWGAWSGGGMVTGEVEQELRGRGVKPMAPDVALKGLAQALESESIALGVADVDWERFGALWGAGRARRLFEELDEAMQAARSAVDGATGTGGESDAARTLRAELDGLTESERTRHVEQLVARVVARVLGRSDPAELDHCVGYLDLGLDSMMALQLRKQLMARTGLRVSATLAFDHPTVERTARWLLQQLGVAAEQVTEQRAVRSEEPIAVVGVGLRLPGGAESLDDLWRLLAEGEDTLREIPRDRFDIDAVYDPDPEAEGRSYVRHASLLDDVAGFDAALFGIAPREAALIDPQHRLLLEASWTALEHAGIAPRTVRDSAAGVFVGATVGEYARMISAENALGPHAVTGMHPSFAAGRVAYHLGLHGPTLAVDTACSSSLVAVHLACEALRRGECSLALAGGVQVLASPDTFVQASRLRAVAPDGRSKAFSDAADGFGRGEGVGVLVLMRQSQAEVERRTILGVIRGGAVNHDGPSSGIAAPSGIAQQAVLRAALANAGLSAADIDAVECHGTGTKLGDPIEVRALHEVYGRDRAPANPLLIGAVKANVGHLEPAAGVASLLKVLASLANDALPPSLHSQPLNSEIPWSELSLRVVDRLVPWTRNRRTRRAGVSSFGLSGTNAHLIVEEAPPASAAPDAQDTRADRASNAGSAPAEVSLVLSGETEAALRRNARRLATWLERRPHADLVDVGHSLVTTRSMQRRRVVVTCSVEQRQQALARLRGLGAGEVVDGVEAGAEGGRGGKLVVMFTGQGSQRPGMGRQLYLHDARFRREMDRVAEAVTAELDRPVLELMFAEEGPAAARALDQTELAQPALFTLEVALWRRLLGSGIRPDVLLGHSIGEISAVCAAGMLSLSDAARLVVARGRAMQRCTGDGAMVSVRAPEPEVRQALQGVGGVDVAAVNGPAHVVISGEADGVERVAGALAARGVRVKRLRVSHAFHSGQMEPAMAELQSVGRELALRDGTIAVHGLLLGRTLRADDLRSGEYWARQVREGVAFWAGVEQLATDGARTWLECGPGGVLCGLVEEGTDASVRIASLRRGERGVSRPLALLHASGHRVDWSAESADSGAGAVALPTYAFDRSRYWLAEARSQLTGPATARGLAHWLYEEQWRERRRRGADAGAPGQWLLLDDVDGDRDTDLAGAGLEEAGAEVIRVSADVGTDGLTQRIRQARELAGILVPVSSGGLTRAIAVVQTLAATASTAPVWLVTRGAVAVDGAEPVAPGQTAVWGLCRAVSLELPDRLWGLVDVGGGEDPAVWKQLAGALQDLGAEGEDQLALHGGRCWVRRVVRATAVHGSDRFETSGTALVTGGTGALGARAARWLVQHGATRVVLVSRRGADAARTETLDLLQQEARERGATVCIEACDVTDAAAVQRLVREIEAGDEPLRTVVHAAGVGSKCRVSELTAERVAAEVGAKLDGARHLDAALGERPLDAFVLYGSIAGLWGSGEQSAYAAANAYLDGLARRRRAAGLAGTVVHWGAWSGGGMVSSAVEQDMRRRGVRAMAPETALDGLAEALGSRRVALGVAQLDWERFGPLWSSGRARRLFEELPEAMPAPGEAAETTELDSTRALRTTLGGLPAAERSRRMEQLVAEVVAQVLGLPDSGALDRGVGYIDLGLDSLMAIEMRKQLTARTGLELGATLAFDHPTVERTARWLLAQIEGAAEVAEVQRAEGSGGPIAVVGVGLRLPGGAETLDALWRVLSEGRDTLCKIPRERFDIDAVYDPDPEARGRSYVRHAALLDDVAGFDAALFGISPREAAPMDPQHRLLLEASWTALEHAGIPPHSLRDSATGVFVGATAGEYTARSRSVEEMGTHGVAGAHPSFAAGRVAYHLGLHGPALAVDTACSSSLVALHLACDALRRGECQVALAGGVSVIASAEPFIILSQGRAVAADGRCKTFSDAADGYGRGEGVGVLALMPLSAAQAEGRRVLAVIRGSALNHDGASSGIAAPNGSAQEEVLRAALASAGLSATEVDVVECHGTGTKLGDPIEVRALADVYGRGREVDRPLLIGAVKSNLGHLEAASGVAGVLKILAAFANDALPPSLHCEPRNSEIPWDQLGVRVTDAVVPWRHDESPRRAGVSSFGASGTNAHLILEEPPVAPSVSPVSTAAESPPTIRQVPLVLTAETSEALAAQAARLADWIDAHPSITVDDVALSLATTRSPLRERCALVAADAADAQRALRSVAEGGSPSPSLRATARRRRAVFIYSGHGSQAPGMCGGLLDDPVFDAGLREADAAVQRHGGFSVRELLHSDPAAQQAALAQLHIAQPTLFAVAHAIAHLWQAYGVVPSAVIGHSQGEVAAAVTAGALSVDDGARVACLRSRLWRELEPGAGTMLSVSLPVDVVEPQLASYPGLSVAVVNGSGATVVAGAVVEIEALAAELSAENVFCKRIAGADYAGHSPQVEPLLPMIVDGLTELRPRPTSVPLVSTVHGEVVDGAALGPSYWAENMRWPVRFDRALATLDRPEEIVFVEISAHPLLVAPLGSAGFDAVVGSLHRKKPEGADLRWAAAQVHAHGLPVDWAAILPASVPSALDLPTYAFDRRPYWIELPKAAVDLEKLGMAPAAHPLLGARTELADGTAVFTAALDLSAHPWLGDHRVLDLTVVPGAAFVEVATHAASALGLSSVAEAVIEAPLVLDAERPIHLQVLVEPGDGNERPYSIDSRPADDPHGPWTRHVSGALAARSERPAPLDMRWPVEGAEPVAVDGLYDRLSAAGVAYGPAFRGLQAVWTRGEELYVEAALPEALEADAAGYGVHPALLDAVLHGVAAAGGDPALPFEWSDVQLHAVGAREVRARLRWEERAIAVELYDASGEPVATARRVAHRPFSPEQLRRARTRAGSLYRMVARPVDAAGEVAVGVVHELEAPAEGAPDVASIPYDVNTLVARWGAASHGPCTAADVHARAAAALAWLQGWVSVERLASTRVVWITERATGLTGAGADAASAALWGMARAFRAEHPDRILVLLDLPDDATCHAAGLLDGLPAGEDELVLNDGAWHAVRLAAVPPHEQEEEPEAPHLRASGTIVLTGATGGLGRETSRHLVTVHGVKHLLLLSRSGEAAEGASALVAELKAAGASTVTLRRCDVGQREEVAAALASVPASRPLAGVFHLAAVADDGLLASQSSQRLDAVLLPKVDGAFHLHELTRDAPLDAFVLFSSTSGTIGSAAQMTYSAANAAVDALALARARDGLPAHSIAWGSWGEVGGAARLDAVLRGRMRRAGFVPLAVDEGLALLDAALVRDEPVLVAAHLDRVALQRRADERPEALTTVLRGLVRKAARKAAASGGSSLEQKLAGLATDRRLAVILEAVRGQIATVFGLASPEDVPAERPLRELGLDSLMALEARNRIAAAVEHKLPATLLYDCPTATEIARYLERKLAADGTGAVASAARPAIRVAPGAEDEPIAVVSMACRYPGDITTPEELWSLVSAGGDAVSDLPRRPGWDADALYDPNPDARGKTYCRRGSFLHDAAMFDPSFFRISPREAATIDPQQRLLLEVAWEALERAKIVPSTLEGSLTGVYAGIISNDYFVLVADATDEAEGYVVTGSSGATASGRISYTLGLQGPAVSVDTACSSSLVAMHLAMQALRRGECDLALAAGVTVMATPTTLVEFSRQRGLAPDGRCKPFSDAADGTSVGEGCGLVLLERLSDARRHGRQVLAVLRGSAVNQDGRSQGFSAPNGPSQERVIESALRAAGLGPDEVDAVEAHGTGTKLGDPIEAGALLATYGAAHTAERPLYVGSVKSNFGHTQGAAGVAGVIKLVMALQHEQLPVSLHAEEPTRHVDWTQGHVELLAQSKPWPRGGRVRRAAVSSFGISGTNVHLILEEAPAELASMQPRAAAATPTVEGAAEAPTSVGLLVSGATEGALRGNAVRLAEWLASEELAMRDLAYSLATSRTHHRVRGAVVVGSEERDAAVAALAALGSGARTPSVIRMPEEHRPGRLALMFTGQGSQWAGMGRALYEADTHFRMHLDRVVAALDVELGRPLLEVMFADEGSELALQLDETQYAQPALFALEIALWRRLQDVGLKPDVVCGHSVGEVSAAHAGGLLNLEDAAKLVVWRGRLMQRCPRGGGMASVRASEDEVSALLPPGVSLAAVNGADQVVVAGDAEAVEELAQRFEGDGKKVTRLTVSHAFHSAHMDGAMEELEQVAAGLTYRTGQVPVHGLAKGAELCADDLRSGRYWAEQVRQGVRFYAGVKQLEAGGIRTWVECGPRGVLSALVSEACEGAATIPALRKHEASVLRALATVHAAGHAVDWDQWYGDCGARVVDLPTYAFDRAHYWVEPSAAGDGREVGLEQSEHPLLGGQTELPDGSALYTGRWDVTRAKWLAEHRVHGEVLVPGSALVELALHAAQELGLSGVGEAVLGGPLVLAAGRPRKVQLQIGAEEGGVRSFQLTSRGEEEGDGWLQHASGELVPADGGVPAAPGHWSGPWPPRGAQEESLEGLYERIDRAGVSYGETFRGLRRVYRGADGDTWYAEVEPGGPVAKEAEGYTLHPVVLDAALHTVALMGEATDGAVKLPFEWRGVRVHAVGASSVRAELRCDGDELAVELYEPSGAPVASIAALVTRAASPEQVKAATRSASSLYRVTLAHVAPGAGSGDAPRLVQWRGSGAAIDAVHDVVARAVAWLADWSKGEDAERVVWVTRGALGEQDDGPDLAMAALWGVGRAFQIERPDLDLILLDAGDAVDIDAIAAGLPDGEHQLAWRDGALHALRLSRDVAARETPPAIDPSGTVLLVGGHGALGRATAEHLVAELGARHLVIAGRSATDAESGRAWAEELELAGAESVTFRTCDVSRRADVEACLASIPPERPLQAVFHLAAVVQDALVEDQTRERLDAALAPKVDGALHLHQLTRDLPLRAFVLFSSAAGTLGNAGQVGYAAANAALDALAELRVREGLPATSIALGPVDAGLTSQVSEQARERLVRIGVRLSSLDDAIEMLDGALRVRGGAVVALPIDRGALGRAARDPAVTLPSILNGLGGARRVKRAGEPLSLVDLLARTPEAERAVVVLDLVRGELASVLGVGAARDVPEDLPLQQLGLDSLAAVEVRNRLSRVVGKKLPATLLFDHPTAQALAEHLSAVVAVAPGAAPQPSTAAGLVEQLERLDLDALVDSGLAQRLFDVMARIRRRSAESSVDAANVSDDDLLQLVDAELEGWGKKHES